MASIDDFSLGDRINSYLASLPSPLSYCLPSSSRAQDDEPATSRAGERESLLANTAAADGDEYDDADAISLLSNIADEDGRRARRRARRRNGGAGKLLACGLFGRSKKQIEATSTPRPRSRRAGHSRNASDSSVESAADTRVESGDEDAGMLPDEAIAVLSSPRKAGASSSSASNADAAKRAKAEQKAQEEARRAAERDVQLAEEEARLAAEEEAAIVKARRKAERRAAREGLLRVREESASKERGQWRTEAEAEAAAGGFGLGDMPGEGVDQQDWQGQGMHEGQAVDSYAQDEYMQGYDNEGYGPFAAPEEHARGAYFATPSGYAAPQPQPEVVHHHHYYHAPPPAPAPPSSSLQPSINASVADRLLPSPTNLPALPSPSSAENEAIGTEPDEDEDDADIAGLGFSKRKGARRGAGGSRDSGGSGSGSRNSGSASGLRGHVMSNGSAAGLRGDSSAGGSAGGSVEGSSSAVPRYRDRPRRHERKDSRSTTSSSGRPFALPSPSALPNLYEPLGPGIAASPSSPAAPGSIAGVGGSDAGSDAGRVRSPLSPNALSPPLSEGTGFSTAPARRAKKSWREKRSGNGESSSAGSASAESGVPAGVQLSGSPAVPAIPAHSSQQRSHSPHKNANAGAGLSSSPSGAGFPSVGLGRSWGGGGGGLNTARNPQIAGAGAWFVSQTLTNGAPAGRRESGDVEDEVDEL